LSRRIRSKAKPLARLLDANANRCREGLRVAEDVARFLREDRPAASLAKRLRHAVTRGMAQLPQEGSLLKARDSLGDVGGRTFSRDERSRSAVDAVLASNLHRAQEAARVLEEFAKLSSRPAAYTFKRLRYGIYDLEKKLR
jgi:thiamine-phosphate pyrophosphorylase